jgi:hypothetical protein
MLGRLTAPSAAVALLVPAAADAAVFKVVEATHSSTSSKDEQNYTGTSTVTWKRTKQRSLIQVNGSGAQQSGIGEVKVRGAYSIDVTTSFPGRCAWTTRTGDDQYPGIAPEPFNLMVSPDPRNPGRTLVSFTAQRATLSNGYLGTECSTSISGEPDTARTNAKSVAPKTFKRKTVKLRFAGATDEQGIDYRWSTTLVLKKR